jgi:hypothetical protein
MSMIYKACILIFLIPFFISAQKEIVSQQNAWVMYTGNHQLSNKWGVHTEYQWRRSDGFSQWQQSLLRIGVDYYAKSSLQLTAGYGWIKSFPYGQQPIPKAFNEHRIWEQAIIKSPIGRVDIQHRYRLEQRFLEDWMSDASNTNWTMNGYNVRQRLRYRLFAAVPLSRKEWSDNTLFLALYDEPFLGFGKGIGKNILDQNRLYFALGWRFNKDLNVQIGYLNQYIVKSDGVKAERNHTLQIGLTYNVDFRSIVN